MHWKMREEYKIAYDRAAEVLGKINYKENYKENGMIRTASVIDAVEELTGIDVKFAEYDFSKLTDKKKKVNVEHYGAAMCVSENDNAKTATIFLNNKATAKAAELSPGEQYLPQWLDPGLSSRSLPSAWEEFMNGVRQCRQIST